MRCGDSEKDAPLEWRAPSKLTSFWDDGGYPPRPALAPSMSPTLRRQGLVIVATLATAYVASHFFRAANVTIGLDLMRDLQIGPEALGALTGAFFLSLIHI